VAQWSGGFAGNTHATRVNDAEAALRHAVSALKAGSASPDMVKAAKTVRQLAKRLLSARVRMLKARLSALQDASAGGTRDPESQELAPLRQRLAEAQAQGLAEILVEFSAKEALEGDNQR